MKFMNLLMCFTLAISTVLGGCFSGGVESSDSTSGDPPSTSVPGGNNPVTPAEIEEKDYPWFANTNGTTRFNDIETSPDYPMISEDIEYTVYYFDSENGNDNNDGLSKQTPKKSVVAAESIISAVRENKPTQVLFKAGSEYEATTNCAFEIGDFAAKEESPLIVGVYDATETEKYAHFIGAKGGSAVNVRNSNVRVFGLEVSGPESYWGIHVTPKRAGLMENIVINGCYAHDINFRLNGRELPEYWTWTQFDVSTIESICLTGAFTHTYGGIIFEANTSKAKGPSWFENVWIEDNDLYCVSRVGIWVSGNWTYRPGLDWGVNPYYNDEIGYYPHKNFYIRDNYLDHCGGDGIILCGTIGGFIERNTCYHAQFLGRQGKPSAGIWTHSCQYVTMQFNESAYTHTGIDGQGFDIDFANNNIIFQYNYAHHNEGGGLLMCNTYNEIVQYDEHGEFILDEDGVPVIKKMLPYWGRNLVRNNVFVDNKVSDLIFSGTVHDIRVENNLCIAPELEAISDGQEGPNATRLYRVIEAKTFGDSDVTGKNWSISNNIFLMRNKYEITMNINMTFSTAGGWKLDNNVFYGFHETFYEALKTYSEVTNVINENPQLATTTALRGYANAKSFTVGNAKLQTGGSWLVSANKYDFNGTDVSGKGSYYGPICG